MSKSRLGTQRYTFKPFEDESDLECICQIVLRNRDVGAYLLRKGRRFTFVFGFQLPGFHILLSPTQAETTLARLSEGLKGLRPGEHLRLHWCSFADDTPRQQELADLIRNTDSQETQFLLMAQQRSTRDLTISGDRQPKQLYCFATYPLEPGKANSSDRIEKLIAWLVTQYETFKGQREAKEQQRYVQMLTSAFTDGFLHWEQQLNARMGLQASPMTANQLWGYLWRQFNDGPPPEVPQCLTLQEVDGEAVLEEQIQSPLHAVSVLIRGTTGKPTHPRADRQWLKVRDKLVGAVALEVKPFGFTSPEHQLYYLWQAASQLPDCEFVCELSAADRVMARMTLQRLTRQSYTATLRAQQLKDVDVSSQLRAQKSVEAQAQIFEGAVPIWVNLVAFVHRQTPQDLSESCQKLTNAFPQGNFVREMEIAWKLWLNALPIVDDWLFRDGRRQMYLTNEVPGLMPVACPKAFDSQGLELITREGNMPLLIDYVGKHRGMLIFGETRSGKSVLASDIFVGAVARGMNVISLDYPKPDGTTTYTDLVKFFGPQGAYFDIGSECNNLFQIPDLSQLSEKQRQERLDDYKEFLVKALNTMVMGAETENQLGKRVHTVLWQALTVFFSDSVIQQRYQGAFASGFGSASWQQMPTLKDFVETVAHLDLGIDSDSLREAISTILLELRGWLSSRVGKAISQPSTIRTDAQFTVFALRNVGDNIDAAVLALSAQSMAFRKALEVSDSLLAIDESPILFKYNGIAQIIGQVCANGAKSGIRPLIIGQDPDTIADSVAGSQILQNLNTRFIGAIQPNALQSYERLFGYDPAVLRPNTSEAFRTDPIRLCSHWLVDVDARLTPCSHYPSPELLAAVANNPKEQRARQRVLAGYGNKFQGYAAFAKAYVEALRSGRSLDSIAPQSPISSFSETDFKADAPVDHHANGHRSPQLTHFGKPS